MPRSCGLSFGAPPNLSAIRTYYTHSRHLGRRCGAIPDGTRAMQSYTNSSLVSCSYCQPRCTTMIPVPGGTLAPDLPWLRTYLDKPCADSWSVARFIFEPRYSPGISCMLTGPFSACVHAMCKGTGRKAILLSWLPFRPSGLQTKLYSGQEKMHDLHEACIIFCMCMLCAMGLAARQYCCHGCLLGFLDCQPSCILDELNIWTREDA